MPQPDVKLEAVLMHNSFCQHLKEEVKHFYDTRTKNI